MRKKISLSLLSLGLIAMLSCEYTASSNNNMDANMLQQFNNPLKITQHAKQRMKCRSIDSFEIREIIQQMNINYKKSEINAPTCKKKYAFEGISHDNQNLRIIIAPCDEKLHIVTVIDLDNDANCN